MESERSSPWWYRRRDIVFAVIFFTGFWVGSALWSPFHHGSYIPLFVWLGAGYGPAVVTALFGVGVFFTVLCFAVRCGGASYLRAAIVWSANARTDAIVVDGPFRYTRNPLYLGNLFMAAGIGVLATPAGFVVLLGLHVVFINMLIAWEERGLAERYGTAFSAYCKMAPRLFPRLRPAPVENPVAPSLKEGLQSEIFSLSVIVGMLSLALPVPPAANGDQKLYIFWGIMLLGMTVQRLVARQARSTL
ncbi:MAG: hypothetical protein NVSMB31_19350 [Vulcanimicrobiaceae bacterium]